MMRFGKLVAEYGGLQSSDEGGVKYILSDWQGSVRAILNNSGFVQSRADYTTFGEEIQSGIGLRTAIQGFSGGINTREGYGLTERDDSTGLNHTWFRKNENRAGRWTSPDPYNGSMSLGNPQSFNRYSYVENQPTNYVDPSGLQEQRPGTSCSTGKYGGYKDGIIGEDGKCYAGPVEYINSYNSNDPFTLTGNAAILYLWNPTGRSYSQQTIESGDGGSQPRTKPSPDPIPKVKKSKRQAAIDECDWQYKEAVKTLIGVTGIALTGAGVVFALSGWTVVGGVIAGLTALFTVVGASVSYGSEKRKRDRCIRKAKEENEE